MCGLSMRRLLFASVASIVCACAAGAEAADSEIVAANADRDLLWRAPTPEGLRETARAETLVGPERLAQQNIASITDLAERTPGLIATGPDSEFAQAMARGFVIDTYALDGVPMTAAFGQSADLFLYDRVEILRGPAGVASAVGGPGGAINLVRKRPLRDPTVSAMAGGGSWNNGRAEIDVSAPVTDAVAVRAGLAYQDRDQFVDIAHQSRRVAFVTVGVALNPTTELTFGGHLDRYRGADFLGLPGVASGAAMPDLPRSTYGAADWNHYDLDASGVFGELSHTLANGWITRLSAGYSKAKRDFTPPTLTALGYSPALQGLALLSTAHRRQDEAAAAFDLNARGDLGDHGRLVVGANALDTTDADAFASGPNLVVDLYASPFRPPPITNPLAATGKSRVRQYGLYGQLELTPASALTLTLGGRFDWRRRTDRAAGASLSSRLDTKGRFTPNLGLVWDLNRTWSAYASYGETFEPQAGPTRSGGPIGPVVSRQYEAGLKALFGDRLAASLAVYRIDQTGRQIPDPSLVVYYVAAGEARSQGVELQADGEAAPGWRLSAGYSYNDNEDLRDSLFSVAQGRRYALAMPKHSLKLWTDYQPVAGPLRRLSIGGGVRWQSRTNGFLTLADVPTDIRQPVFAVADLRLAYDLTDTVTLAVNLNNVFDQRYYERVTGVQSGNLYGAPRNLFISARARF